MIAKTQRGDRLGGLIKYLFGPGRAEEHSNQRVVASSDPTWLGTSQPDPETLAQLIAELDEPVVAHGDSARAGYVYHLVVSVPASDGQLLDERWQQAAQRFADKLGFDDQVHWVAINHGPSTNGNDHIHFVANLIRADEGRAHRMPFDRLKQRAACIELEQEFGLSATSPAGLGEASLTRREVELLRSGEVANVSDLAKHRVATIVRAVALSSRSEPEFVERLRGEGLVVKAYQQKNTSGVVSGYSVAQRSRPGHREPLLYYGGGRLGKDLRLPALRTRWGQTDQQRKAAASAWFADTSQRRAAQPGELAAASQTLHDAAGRLQKVPPQDRFSWYVAATESAGMVAAAAASTDNDRVRRDLVKAWQAINRATPTATSVGVDVAAGDAAQLRFVDVDARAEPRTEVALERPSEVWPVTRSSAGGSEFAALLGGASRVLMASRLASAPAHARTQALVVQAIELAAQIARTIAAQRDATDAQRRAAEATARAAQSAAAPARVAGWGFTKPAAEVLQSARDARVAGGDAAVDVSTKGSSQPNVDPIEHGK